MVKRDLAGRSEGSWSSRMRGSLHGGGEERAVKCLRRGGIAGGMRYRREMRIPHTYPRYLACGWPSSGTWSESIYGPPVFSHVHSSQISLATNVLGC